MSSEIETKNGRGFVLEKKDGRKVGYQLVRLSSKEHKSATSSGNDNVAVIYFYALGGHSIIVDKMAKSFEKNQYKCSFLCVDRPNCGDSDALPKPESNSPLSVNSNKDQDSTSNMSYDTNDLALHRIHGHVDDVMAVLEHEDIREVYILGICLGHPYAIELGRRLLVLNRQHANDEVKNNDARPKQEETLLLEKQQSMVPKLKGLTLVSPFVSTVCPYSLSIARKAASYNGYLPSFVLSTCIEAFVSVTSMLMSKFLTPDMMKKLISDDEQREYGWIDPIDFDDAVQFCIELSDLSLNSKGIETRVAIMESWQYHICDRFAQESGCGLQISSASPELQKEGNNDCDDNEENQLDFPIQIYACENDPVSSIASIKWLIDRCYNKINTDDNNVLIIEKTIKSHENMTLLGGPVRDPKILSKIVHNWGLC